MSAVRFWSGAEYDRLSTPMEAMGLEVLERLELRGDETVLDAGCGSGRVTQALAARLPRGRVIGVDASASMIATARARLGGDADLRVAELTTLDLGGERVDAVLSTATFHWVADHDALFAALRGVLRDGGRLVAQCGGRGNIARLHAAAEATLAEEPFAEHVAGWTRPWRFAGPEETEACLRGAGFALARAWLAPRPVTPSDARAFLAEVNLGAHRQQLPEALRGPFVDAVLDRLGGSPLTIDYVRLNLDATA